MYPTTPRRSRPAPVYPTPKRRRLAGKTIIAQKGSDQKDTSTVYLHYPKAEPAKSMAEKYRAYKGQAVGTQMITRFRSMRVSAANAWTVINTDDRGRIIELFTPRKFKDVEAVAFNGKALAENGYLTVASATNGPTMRDICVMNSWVRFDFKNVSQHTTTVEMYLCSMKCDKTYAGTYPDADLALALDEYSGNSGSTTAATLYVDPMNLKNWTAMWNVRRVKMIMEPGETCSHRVQGPKMYVLDPKKHVEMGTTEASASPIWLGPEMIGNGMYCFFRILNQITFLATNDAGTAANANMGTRKIYPAHPVHYLPGTDGSLQGGIICRMQEYTSVRCPMGVDDVDQRNILVDFVTVTGNPVDVQIDSDQAMTAPSNPL